MAAAVSAGLLWPIGLAHRASVRGAATLSLLGLVGYAHLRTHDARHAPGVLPPADFFHAELLEAPSGQGDWVGADARVFALRRDGRDSTVHERVRLMFERPRDRHGTGDGGATASGRAPRSEPDLLLPGARLVADVPLDTVRPPRNPDAFDYAALLASRGVRYQAWLRPGRFAVVAPAASPTVLVEARTWISDRLERGIARRRELGVAKALLLGDRSAIDERTRLAYTATGAVHVLAVSGLHTGVVAFVLVWLLQRALRRRYLPLQFGLLLAGLLAYVALTGYSPSVIRASIMFAIIFAGRLWRRDAQGLNNLGAAALVTLVYDPSLLFALGFQLSYLAVAGIMLFYRPLRRHFLLPYGALPRVSELAAVAVAATVATAPLTVYHFHQFPVYFALSGVVAVPLVSLALPLLLATVALDGLLLALGVEVGGVYAPATWLIWCCNAFLEWLARLPYVLVEGLHPSPTVATLALVTVGLSGVLAANRRRSMYYATVVAVVVTTATQLADAIARRGRSETIVYSLRGGHVVDVRRGGYLYTATGGRPSPEALSREVLPHRYAMGSACGAGFGLAPVYADSAFAFYATGDTRWVVLRDPRRVWPPATWALDWVSIDEPRGVDPEALAAAFPDAKILLGRRPPPWERDAWAPLAHRVHLLREGAYVAPAAPGGQDGG